MRILHILSTLNIGSGIANFAVNHYREAVGLGVQFDFLVFKKMENDFYDEVVKLGARVFYIEKPSLHVSKYKKAIKRFFSEHAEEWDIVHIHEILVQKFIAKTCKKYGGVKKVVIHSHAAKFVLPTYGVSRIKNAAIMAFKRIRNAYLLSGIKKNCDYYFACSKAAGLALYGKNALSNKNFYISKNAIDTQKYVFDKNVREKYRETFGLVDNKVIVLVGRFCSEKNQVFFLDVFKKIIDKDSSYRLMLVGDGELRDAVVEKIDALGLQDKVVLTGNRDDVPALLNASDLFVLPSIVEGLGIVLIEAQAAGLPCVRSDMVPDEAVITPYVKTISLNDGAEKWADEIVSVPLERYDCSTYIYDAGYDITESAKRLIKTYCDMVGETV